MASLNISIRAVLYLEEGRWLARCLEFDLIGDGHSPTEALNSLRQASIIQLEDTIESGNLDNLFSPADRRFFKMFAAGKERAEGDLHIEFHRDGIQIECLEAREFNESDLALT